MIKYFKDYASAEHLQVFSVMTKLVMFGYCTSYTILHKFLSLCYGV